MINFRNLILIISIFISVSCDKKIYSETECNDLSMKSFKGMPKAANEFQKHCQNIKIKYTHELCQEALNELIISGNYSAIIQKYGNPTAGCFTENDLNKFRKR